MKWHFVYRPSNIKAFANGFKNEVNICCMLYSKASLFMVCNGVSKTWINDLLEKFYHSVNNSILKDLCKFQIDTPTDTKVTAVQRFENLHTFILQQPCWRARERPQPIFPYNRRKNSPTSFARNSVFVGSNDFKFGTETRFIVLQAISKFRTNRS